MSNTCTIFYFEDDPHLAREVTEYLQGPSIEPDAPRIKVKHYRDAVEAVNAVGGWTESSRPDAALLDLSQQNYTEAGLRICTEIKRRYPAVPVVFLSDHASLREQKRAYDVGAANYLSKELRQEPDYKEHLRVVLLAQMKNIKGILDHEPGVYTTGSLRVNADDSQVQWRNKSVHLNSTDIGILVDLIKPGHCGKTRQYLQLLRAGNLTTAMDREQLRFNIRKRIQCIRGAFAGVDPDFESAWQEKRHGLLNEPGQGYRWQPDS